MPPDTVEIGGLAGWTVALMERIGAPGAGLAIFIENLFPPVPSEVVLPMAGFAARLGRLSLTEAIVWTTLGSVLGAWALYVLGAWLGHERLRTLVARIPLIDVEDIDKTTAWFARHGTKAVFFGRMVPLFRSFISLPAGTERMNFSVFTLLTLLGSLIWNSIFIGAGICWAPTGTWSSPAPPPCNMWCSRASSPSWSGSWPPGFVDARQLGPRNSHPEHRGPVLPRQEELRPVEVGDPAEHLSGGPVAEAPEPGYVDDEVDGAGGGSMRAIWSVGHSAAQT